MFPFCGMLSVTSRLLGDMVSISAQFAAGAGNWVGPSVAGYSRVAGWAPGDILELQNVDDNAAPQGCSLCVVHGRWGAGFKVEVFGVQDKWYREYLHGEDGPGSTAGDRPSTHDIDDLANCQGNPPLIFVSGWRKVSTAGAVDLSAVSQLGGSGSRVVSMAKGIVTRWKAESGRSDNFSRVNAVDSAGGNPDAG